MNKQHSHSTQQCLLSTLPPVHQLTQWEQQSSIPPVTTITITHSPSPKQSQSILFTSLTRIHHPHSLTVIHDQLIDTPSITTTTTTLTVTMIPHHHYRTLSHYTHSELDSLPDGLPEFTFKQKAFEYWMEYAVRILLHEWMKMKCHLDSNDTEPFVDPPPPSLTITMIPHHHYRTLSHYTHSELDSLPDGLPEFTFKQKAFEYWMEYAVRILLQEWMKMKRHLNSNDRESFVDPPPPPTTTPFIPVKSFLYAPLHRNCPIGPLNNSFTLFCPLSPNPLNCIPTLLFSISLVTYALYHSLTPLVSSHVLHPHRLVCPILDIFFLSPIHFYLPYELHAPSLSP